MSNQSLTKIPAWHAEAKQLLTENFGKIHAAFTDATKRAVWMGMFLNHIKARGKEDGSIPHGQFGPWLEKNVPEVPIRTAQTYMNLATGVCEKGNFEIRQFSVFAQSGQLPPPIEKIVEGKTQQQLFLEFKNVDDEGNPRGKGQLPGSKGLTKAQRELAQQRAEEARLNELEEEIVSLNERLLEIADVKHLGMMDTKLLQKFVDAADTASGFARRTLASRKEAK